VKTTTIFRKDQSRSFCGKVGRKNQYEVVSDMPLRHPLECHRPIGDLLQRVTDPKCKGQNSVDLKKFYSHPKAIILKKFRSLFQFKLEKNLVYPEPDSPSITPL